MLRQNSNVRLYFSKKDKDEAECHRTLNLCTAQHLTQTLASETHCFNFEDEDSDPLCKKH